MMLNKKTPSLATLVLVLCGCGTIPVEPQDDDTSIIGSGNVVTESRSVSGFAGVSLHGVARITIEQTSEETLTITAEDNVIPVLLSNVRDGRLILGPEENIKFETHAEIVYHLHVQNLSSIEINGVIYADAVGIDTEALDVDILGVSRLTASGRAPLQDVFLSGVSTYHAQALASEEITIDGSGVIPERKTSNSRPTRRSSTTSMCKISAVLRSTGSSTQTRSASTPRHSTSIFLVYHT